MQKRLTPAPAVLLIFLCVLVCATTAPSIRAADSQRAPTADELAFFERRIRPVLVEKCYSCHSATAEKLKGGLLLDTRAGTRQGGDTGHAVVPSDLKQSLLLKAIRYTDKDLQMPPPKSGGQLPADVIADFEKWILLGAPDPRDGQAPPARRGIDLAKGREHWAFQAPKKSPPPAIKDTAWPRADLDRFILADLESRNLHPVADADPHTLIRRLYFDLLGLPPTPEEVAAFVADYSPNSSLEIRHSKFSALVDRLLASPQFGERWGRHWLDVARYAESSGKEVNLIYPHAWRYRDYAIRAFNDDKPYDRFLREQLAGDLLPAANDLQRAEQTVATGFLALGPKSHNTRELRQFQLDLADEQIDAVSQAMLGLTVACARCHDHKFDPIPTRDYYALAGIFLSTETRFGTPPLIQNAQPTALLPLPATAGIPDADPMRPLQRSFLQRQLEQNRKERDDLLAEARRSGDRSALVANPRLIRAESVLSILEKQLARYDDTGAPLRFAMGVKDRSDPRDARILQRGELTRPGDTVPRGFLQILNPTSASTPAIAHGSGRRELADAIASPDNPLTARVMANRIWLHLFGRGLVPTPDNFGATGQPPPHPALLDHLAQQFIAHGWSVKKLIREIVLSRTYQLGAAYDPINYAADPDNTWHWRMSPRRLDAEAIRDSLLAVSGRLELTPPRGSQVAGSEGPVQTLQRFNLLDPDRACRSVYLPILRDLVPDALAVFDFAEPSLVVGDREDTTVPAQALFLMNSPFATRTAEAFADRLFARSPSAPERIRLAYQLAFGRPPTAPELSASETFFQQFPATEKKAGTGETRTQRAALTAFCQALLASAEFRFLN